MNELLPALGVVLWLFVWSYRGWNVDEVEDNAGVGFDPLR